jgi:uncharacterized membrane protein
MTTGRRVGSILASASVAAIGASFGRDLYRLAKKNVALLVILLLAGAVFYLPYKGAKLVCSGERFFSWRWTFLRALPGAALLVVGLAVLNLIALVISNSVGAAAGGRGGFFALLIATGLGLLLAAIGTFRGVHDKRSRARAAAVIRHNTRFLETLGFIDADGGDASYEDREGNRLRLITTDTSKLTFLVTGRRKQRAYIALDSDGRMTSYSGVVTL